MAEWRDWRQVEIEGLTCQIKERWDRRNRQGATEYMVHVLDGERLIHFERVSQSTWFGHANGQLLLPDIINRARAKMAAA